MRSELLVGVSDVGAASRGRVVAETSPACLALSIAGVNRQSTIVWGQRIRLIQHHLDSTGVLMAGSVQPAAVAAAAVAAEAAVPWKQMISTSLKKNKKLPYAK